MASAWWLIGCEPEIPSDVLSPDRMAEILTDIHLAEARVSKMRFRSADSSQAVYRKLQANILEKYETDSVAYARSYNYYVENPDRLQEVYQDVLSKLEDREKKLVIP